MHWYETISRLHLLSFESLAARLETRGMWTKKKEGISCSPFDLVRHEMHAELGSLNP